MSSLVDRFKRTLLGRRLGDLRKRIYGLTYRGRLAIEQRTFAAQEVVHDLPAIYHYWSNRYLRPLLEEFGVRDPMTFFAAELHAAAAVGGDQPHFVSIGSGNCDAEVTIAKLLRERGLRRFTIECIDINAAMLARGRELAQAAGVAEHLRCTRADFNRCHIENGCAAVMANQSLHHVLGLEHLFDQVARALRPGGRFVVHDMIGRNGHARWPEALAEVRRFWGELPDAQRFDHLRRCRDADFENVDYSKAGFEGIRAQDILPLLTDRFRFDLFVPFANIVDPFIDRGIGPNFDIASERDRAFVDRVHARDEELILAGRITPTHMFATLRLDAVPTPRLSRGLRPERCIRRSG